ncbi:MAG: glyoxalase/bleomycin resistance/dioxygenase family protein [Burkholderiales bacterium]|nr:glyoxalase/bleomycin resistance/dioxygenase family protein [Burkholderiales bacterium]
MKRFHVHVAVDDLAQSTRFYNALFGAPPAVEKPDYVKWMLDDPRINFAISARGQPAGVNHLGLQVESDDELAALKAQHSAAALALFDEGKTSCCYAHSHKHWLTDPQGVPWEVYHTMGAVQTFNGESAPTCGSGDATKTGGCCVPDASPAKAAPLAGERGKGCCA